MESNKKSGKWRLIMNAGAITGLMLIGVALILYLLKMSESSLANFLIYMILVAGMYIATRKYRDNEMDGVITFGKALHFSFWVGVFAAIILSFFIYLQILYFDPSMLDKMLTSIEESLLKSGYSDDKAELMMALYRKYLTPASAAFMFILSYAFYGFFISIINALMLKKKGNPFKQAVNEVESTSNNQ